MKTVTHGVKFNVFFSNFENADFSNSDFECVSLQKSIFRQEESSNAILRNASFFDTELSGAKFSMHKCPVQMNVNLFLLGYEI